MLSSSSSSSMIRRVVPFFTTRIRQNYRLFNSSASALSQPQSQSQSQVESTDSVVMTENCVRRIKELQAGEHKEKMLRLSLKLVVVPGFNMNSL
uniref:Putative ovule protein n=1 Tax=Solanum chacoense TaxID=4108 RepID=A0A0V0HMW0_SOLCH